MQRRHFLAGAAALISTNPLRADVTPTLKIVKSPTCGCCGAWADKMQQAGFAIEITNVDQDVLYDTKDRLGITPNLAGCHTAVIGEYFVEGHVPAEDIRRLLTEAPKALGITVPGMPMGSPGMEMGDARDDFDVLLVLNDGSTQVFASHA
ncbi:MAG: DUF411 domain-containing protein [Hyphomicrobiales bacterium]